MANITESAIKKLLPSGRALRLVGQGEEVVQGLGVSLARPLEFMRAVLLEAHPATATETIDEWLALLNLRMEGATLGQKRAYAADTLKSIGGQSLDYLTARVQAVFPDVYIDEDEAGSGTGPFTFYYYVRGSYEFAADFVRLDAIITKYAPLHMEPVYEARSEKDGDVARAGIAITGRARCGRTVTQSDVANGDIAYTGRGLAGAAITGKVPE